MAAHRYWRVYVDRNGSSNVQITELELRSSSGGADLTGSGTASADSVLTVGTTDASKAFDNSNSTRWASTGVPAWLAYDFGTGVAHDIVEVVMTNGSFTTGTLPLDFIVQSSDDGSTWTDEWFATNISAWTASMSKTFTAPNSAVAAHRYWQINISATESGSATPIIPEMELRTAIGGADQTGSGTASGVGGTPASAFDNNTTTAWSSSGNFASLGGWQLSYDFGSGNNKEIVELAITTSASFTANQSPSAFKVQYSDDGKAWKTKWAVSSSTGWTQGITRTFTSPASGSGRQVVFVCT